MRTDAYASLVAFLAHWRALKHASADTLAAQELVRRAAMDEIVAALRPEERAALEAASTEAADTDDGSNRRHRERGELSLARELRARSLLAG